jgi:hypothetical protein
MKHTKKYSLPIRKTIKKIDREKFLKLAHEVKEIFEQERREARENNSYDDRPSRGFLSTI